MLRIGAAVALATISVAALAAGRGADKEAASAVDGLLAAARAGDAAAFEKAIDRPAVREDLRRQMMAVAREHGLEVDGGPSDMALDRMIGPEAVRLAAEDAGELEAHLKKTCKAEVCLTDPDAECVLTFAKVKRAWKLVGMRTSDPAIDVGVDLGG
jgi:hypothetical protein